ncbi:MAG: Ni/Fe hydrogenase subunit alpha [Planctomycetaceae bacterium]|nr:Ni/Fe hydrogenase subunit alpha [Planctomycetaceae bacterium]
MSAQRTFEVKALTRVEGEGRLYVRMNGDTVEHVEFNIYEPPRFFESFLRGREIREVPDITARICGICPVAYQMSACHALEKALGIQTTPEIRALRRLLYCGEWIESHALHIHLLHAPDFLGYESGISMAADHRKVVERGLRLKKVGNEILEVLGGRAIHPINVTVGGFYRAPRVRDLRGLLPDLEWGLEAAIETVRFVAGLEFPDFEQDYECVSLRHPDEYPMNEGRIVTSSGLDIRVDQFEQHFEERHEPQSTALHSVLLPDASSYLVGPLARINLCHQQLPPQARKALHESGIDWPSRNMFQSIVARAIEVVAAYEEALRIVDDYRAEPDVSRIPFTPHAGEGCHATEAPRGLIYHRYRIGDDGLIAEARITPPTSQNQGQIEDDLRRFVPGVLQYDDPEATRRCEHLIRNYDPCISCATHFLKMTIDRGTENSTVPRGPKHG